MAYAFLVGDELDTLRSVESQKVTGRHPNISNFETIELPILTFTSQEPLPDKVTFDFRAESPLIRCTVRNLHLQGNLTSISVEISSNLEIEEGLRIEELARDWLPVEIAKAEPHFRDVRRARIRVQQCSPEIGIQESNNVPSHPMRDSFQFFSIIGRDFSSFNDQLTMALFAVKGI